MANFGQKRLRQLTDDGADVGGQEDVVGVGEAGAEELVAAEAVGGHTVEDGGAGGVAFGDDDVVRVAGVHDETAHVGVGRAGGDGEREGGALGPLDRTLVVLAPRK